MSDRHRHDEFIWALIFSLILNFVFVFALLAQRYIEKSPGLPPFVVSIATSYRALSGQSPAISSPHAIPVAAEKKIAVESPVSFQPQRMSIDPALPTQDNDEETNIILIPAAVMTGAETNLPTGAAAGENATTLIATEITDGRSISGDKMTGDHYTAPVYLGGEKPPYPKRAERNGWEGTVLLSIAINTDGEVEKVGIVKTSGYELLDLQARNSVNAWRFKPARRNGVPIAVTAQQPIIFRATPPELPQ